MRIAFCRSTLGCEVQPEFCTDVGALNNVSELFCGTHQAQSDTSACRVQVHGDVFRPPQYPALLATYAGTGLQLLSMALITMVFAVLGFLSPANRGGLLTAAILLFAFMGVLAGYTSARLYRTFKVSCNSYVERSNHCIVSICRCNELIV